MRLLCHIGTPKTGSTLIQNSCEANPVWLARHGVAYGQALAPDPNHITLFFAAANGVHDLARAYGIRDNEELKRFRRELVEEIAAHRDSLPADIDTVILSSENLTGNLFDPQALARLHGMLTPLFDRIELVIYVRRQDDAILSMYGEFMRRGFNEAPFEKFIDMCLGPQPLLPYLHYQLQLSKWIEIWGRDAITVRLFDRDAFAGGDLLTDFMTVLMGERAFSMEDFVPSPADNRSLSAPAIEALRRLYPAIPFMTGKQPNPTRARLMPFINALPTEPRPVMAAAQARRIMQRFAPANAWLRETFFPDRPEPLFPDRPDHPEEGNLGQLSREDFAAITSRLLDPALTR